MKVKAFRFDLPNNLIAQKLARGRKDIRLLVLFRKNSSLVHTCFDNFVDYLKKGDLLVLNDTAVLPTRMWGVCDKGGQVEVTLVSRITDNVWEAFVRPDDFVRANSRVFFGDKKLSAKLIGNTGYEGWRLKFNKSGNKLVGVLKSLAKVNVPFYIKRDVGLDGYQTVYAKKIGSTQCPTAGLHFTPDILAQVKRKGADIAFITLHIGGSVLPLTVKDYRNFRMYKEYFEVNRATKQKISDTKNKGARVIAVGTTVVRALESAVDKRGNVKPAKGWTDLTIKLGHDFKVVDAFLTNFHLPASSHLLMTSAFAGERAVLPAYRQAIERGYKFLDFGDSMFIL